MTGEQPPLPPSPATGPPPEAEPPPPSPLSARLPWHAKAAAVLFCVFCLELGLFLLFYPWTEGWGRNWWFYLRPEWRPFLLSDQVRGAVSSLGLLNLLIGVRSVFGLRHLAGK